MPKATKILSEQRPQCPLRMKWLKVVKMSYPAQTKSKTQRLNLNPCRLPQVPLGTFMPYIEGPKMDWMVNDGLYHRFLKWHLKCKNILECELAALPERQQCKKSDSLVQRLWHGPVCLLGFTNGSTNIRHNLGKI